MASLDNIFDLTERLEQDGIDYFVVAVQKKANADDEYASDVFYNMHDDEVVHLMKETINEFFESKSSKKSRRGRKPRSDGDEPVC